MGEEQVSNLSRFLGPAGFGDFSIFSSGWSCTTLSKSVHSFGVLLISQLLFKEQVAAIARRAFI